MRFAVAAVILTEPFNAASAKIREGHGNADPKFNGANQQIVKIAAADFPNHGSVAGSFHANLQQQRRKHVQQNPKTTLLKNLKDQALITECNFSASPADVGVLSCGVGEYCVESCDSTLGGYCRSDGMLAKDDTYFSSRRRQQVVGRLNIFEIADLFCYKANTTNMTVSCDCEVDFEAYTGQFSCNFGPDCIDIATGCEGQSVFTMCSTENLSAFMQSQTSYMYTSCYTQRMPASGYSFTYCTDFGYTSSDGPTCSMQVEGVTCDSCFIAIGGGVAEGENCEVFDCTNTPMNYAGDRCKAFSYPALRKLSLVEYLYTYVWGSEGACGPNACNLCGDNGRMTNKNATFTNAASFIDTNSTFPCSEINYAAMTGKLENPEYCQTLPAFAAEPCGCVDGRGSESPGDEKVPTAEPTEESPVDAPPSKAPAVDIATETPMESPLESPIGSVSPTESPVGSGACMGTLGRLILHAVIGLIAPLWAA